MNVQKVKTAFDIDNIDLISCNLTKEQYYNRLTAEIRIFDNMIIFDSTDNNCTDTILRLANILKDEDAKYIVSEILKFSDLNLNTQSSLDRLSYLLNRDPDETLYALRLLVGIENSDDYLDASNELVTAIGGRQNSFSMDNIKLQYGPYFFACSTILGNITKPYISKRSAMKLNPIVGYLDQLGSFERIIDKIRILKLQDI